MYIGDQLYSTCKNKRVRIYGYRDVTFTPPLIIESLFDYLTQECNTDKFKLHPKHLMLWVYPCKPIWGADIDQCKQRAKYRWTDVRSDPHIAEASISRQSENARADIAH